MAVIRSIVKSSSRHRPYTKRPPLTGAQRRARKSAHSMKTADINKAVGDWHAATLAQAEELSRRFGFKPRYFLDRFFHGGAHMLAKHSKVSPWRVFLSKAAAEENADATPGNATRLLDLQQSRLAEYESLSREEKDALVLAYQPPAKLPRPSARGRVADVTTVVKNIKSQLAGLKTRVGIEAFFCVVRNATNYHMEPHWYFTTSALEDYMQLAVRGTWQTAEVGAKLEAFAIAGCDVGVFLNTSKTKARFWKTQIRDMINANLATITGIPDIKMQYLNYERDIVLLHGVDLKGWTHREWTNPSELGTSLPPLHELHQALKNGTCHFVKLTEAERAERQRQYDQAVGNGDIVPHERKKRKDAGKPRGPQNKRRGLLTFEPQSENEDNDNEDLPVTAVHASVAGGVAGPSRQTIVAPFSASATGRIPTVPRIIPTPITVPAAPTATTQGPRIIRTPITAPAAPTTTTQGPRIIPTPITAPTPPATAMRVPQILPTPTTAPTMQGPQFAITAPTARSHIGQVPQIIHYPVAVPPTVFRQAITPTIPMQVAEAVPVSTTSAAAIVANQVPRIIPPTVTVPAGPSPLATPSVAIPARPIPQVLNSGSPCVVPPSSNLALPLADVATPLVSPSPAPIITSPPAIPLPDAIPPSIVLPYPIVAAPLADTSLPTTPGTSNATHPDPVAARPRRVHLIVNTPQQPGPIHDTTVIGQATTAGCNNGSMNSVDQPDTIVNATAATACHSTTEIAYRRSGRLAGKR